MPSSSMYEVSRAPYIPQSLPAYVCIRHRPSAAALTLGPCLPLIRVRSMPVPLLPPSMVSSQASRSNSVRQNKEQREILREVTINP